MKLQIEYNLIGQESVHVETLPIDFIIWERTTKSKISDLYSYGAEQEIGLRIGFEDLAVLAWSVMKRTTGNPTPFDKWAETLENITLAGDVESVDPTEAEA